MRNVTQQRMTEEEMEAAITRVLAEQPCAVVPAEFAGRVRAAIPAVPRARVRRRASRVAGAAAVIGLIAAVCWLAPHARPSFESMAFDMELLVMAELAAVAGWLAVLRDDA